MRLRSKWMCFLAMFVALWWAGSAAAQGWLLVDDDWDQTNEDPDSQGGLPYYTSALDALGIEYTVFDMGTDTSVSPTGVTVTIGTPPTAEEMSQYEGVIWFTGVAWAWAFWPHESVVAEYLDGGGNFILFAQDYPYSAESDDQDPDYPGVKITEFGADYLGMADLTHDVDDRGVQGVAGGIADGVGPFDMEQPLYFAADHSNQLWVDYVVPIDGFATSPFQYVTGEARTNSTAVDTGTFKTVFCAWPLEAIPAVEDRAAILAPIIQWMTPSVAAPTAAFSYAPEAPLAGQAVTFTDESTGEPTSWAWDFGDDATSSEQHPTHSFAAAGTYTVSLTATNDGGSDTATMDVTVGEAPAFTAPDLTLAAAAKAPGNNNAYFYSRVEAFNASDTAMDVAVAYTARGAAKASATATLTIPAHSQKAVFNPLAEWFGLAAEDSDVGSLMFQVTNGANAADLKLQSVVFSRNAQDGSEYGQLFPATRTADAVQAGTSAYLNSTVDAEHFRVVAGATAVADGTTMTWTVVDEDGNELASKTVGPLAMGGNFQYNQPYTTFGLDAGLENFLFRVDVTAGAAIPYASVVDGKGEATYTGTNDPTTISPLKMAQTIYLLELGPIQGVADYSGSASITNFSASEAVIDATFVPRSDLSGDTATAQITIPAMGTVGYEDLVGDVFGVSQVVGTVILHAPNGVEIGATGREFSFIEANGAVDGTAGQLMAGMSAADMVARDTTYHLLGLRQYEPTGGPTERSHFAVFNPSPNPITVTLRLYDGATGAYEGDYLEGGNPLQVEAGELVQINDVIKKINANFDDQPKVLDVTVDGGGAFIKAFRVNTSDDPITIDPQ